MIIRGGIGVKISLIMATVGRVQEVKRVLESLRNQSFRNFELIVVNQNQDNRLDDLILQYSHYMIINHIKIKEHGLSLARNVGLHHATGDLVAFTDDDCWYFHDTFQKVVEKFSKDSSLDGLTGVPVDGNFEDILPSMPRDDVLLNSENVWHAGISITIFLTNRVVKRIGFFDEMLGAGANSSYGSGEETDYLLRALEFGYKLKFFRDVKVGHPNKDKEGVHAPLRRYYLYGCGMGHVLKKHHANVPKKLMVLIRPAGGALIAAITGHRVLALRRIYTFCGRLYGLIS